MSLTEPSDPAPFEPPFFITGGALGIDAPSYVVREADGQLFRAVEHRELCYLLDTRQVGKTSLLARCGNQLRSQGHTVVILDMSGVCSPDLEAGQWYLALLLKIGVETGTDAECLTLWRSLPELSPLSRWRRALETVILPRVKRRLYLFFDEIDALQNLTFPTAAFLGAIRELYQHRSGHPPMDRLAFCLAGAVTPSQLISDTNVTPFNVGTRIELTNFTEKEAAPLMEGLGPNSAQLLRRVLYWTGGHPYLTQSLCQLVRNRNAKSSREVDRLCKERFFSPESWETDRNLTFVRERVLRHEDSSALLSLYRQALQSPVPYDYADPIADMLRLSGLVIAQRGRLRIRNRIYRRLFNRRWISENLQQAEIVRQRKAMWKGVRRASLLYGALTAVAVLVALLNREAKRADRATGAARLTQGKLSQVQGQFAQIQAQFENKSEEVRGLEKTRVKVNKELQTLSRDLENAKVSRSAEVRGFTLSIASKQRQLVQADAALQSRQGELTRIRKQVQYEQDERKRLALARVRLLQRSGAARTVDEDREILLHTREEVQRSLRGLPDKTPLELENLRELVNRPFFRRLRVSLPFVPRCSRFFPDGKHLLVAGEGPWALILDAQSGAVRQRLRVAFRPAGVTVSFADVSADGRWLVTGTSGGEISVFETSQLNQETPRPTRVFQAGAQTALAVTLSADGQYLFYSVSQGGGVLYHLETNKGTPITGSAGTIQCADFNYSLRTRTPAVTALVTGSADGTIGVWGIPSGLALVKPVRHSQGITALRHAGSEDITFATASGEFGIWNWRQDFLVFPGYQAAFDSIKHVRQIGNLVIGVTKGDVMHMWCYARSTFPVITYNDIRGVIHDLSVSQDQQEFSLASSDKTVQVWRRNLPVITNGFGYPLHAEFSPEGRAILTATSDGGIRLSNMGMPFPEWIGNPRQSPDKKPPPTMHQATFLKTKGRIVVANSMGQLQVWKVGGEYTSTNLETFAPLTTVEAHKAPIYNFSYLPDSDRLVSGSKDGTIKVWDSLDWRLLRTIQVDVPINSIRAAPNGYWTAAACADGGSRVFETSTGKQVALLAPKGRRLTPGNPLRPLDVEFSPDGATLAIGERDGKIRLWHWASQALLGELAGHKAGISSLAFSPDGKWLATAGEDGNILLWSWKEVQSELVKRQVSRPKVAISASKGRLISVRFSHDSHWLVTASNEGLSRVFPVSAEACLQLSKSILLDLPSSGGEIAISLPKEYEK
ncbi:AAA-like domain-containing protein [Armatimonas sp.]|uniref:AAA-like domain-containing protein n=1 Tax=Armatimonas sp. TaxID=1872638 RepID=UPI00374D0E77